MEMVNNDPPEGKVKMQNNDPFEKKMEVVIVQEDGSKFPIEIGSSDTILEMKHKIKNHTHLPRSHQVLFFEDKILENNSDIKSYSISHNSTIQLHIFNPLWNPFQDTTVNLRAMLPSSHTSSPLKVDLSDTVLHFKQKLQPRLGIAADNLGLSLGRRNDYELQDDKFLFDYGLRDETLIHVFPKSDSSSSAESQALEEGSPPKSGLNVEVDPTEG